MKYFLTAVLNAIGGAYGIITGNGEALAISLGLAVISWSLLDILNAIEEQK